MSISSALSDDVLRKQILDNIRWVYAVSPSADADPLAALSIVTAIFEESHIAWVMQGCASLRLLARSSPKPRTKDALEDLLRATEKMVQARLNKELQNTPGVDVYGKYF